MKKRINITVDERLIKEFQKFCEKSGMKISTRIELLIKKDLEK